MTDRYFRNRRTIRQYTSSKIDRKVISGLLETAMHAPTTGNMQLYSVIVSEDENMKRKLAPAHFNQPSVMSSAVVLTFCADINRFMAWCNARNASLGFDNFQAWLWAVEDTMIFAQQFVTLAEMSGLGTCYLGTTTYNAPQISEILSLPDYVVPVITVTVGYPANDGELSDRLPVEAIMHSERYQNYDESRINEIYAEKERRPDSLKFVEENAKETLAQVFTDVRYPKSDNEHFSRIYMDFVRNKGFKF